MEVVLRVTDAVKKLRETRLSALRPPTEFFDFHRISRPGDVNQAVSRISYNTRYFSANYMLIIAILAVYAILTSPLLLFSLAFLTGGFAAINKFGYSRSSPSRRSRHHPKVIVHWSLCDWYPTIVALVSFHDVLLARRCIVLSYPWTCMRDRARYRERVCKYSGCRVMDETR
ncbi:PRA1 family protein-domain-containing protein [Scleroderma yunnanense]